MPVSLSATAAGICKADTLYAAIAGAAASGLTTCWICGRREINGSAAKINKAAPTTESTPPPATPEALTKSVLDGQWCVSTGGERTIEVIIGDKVVWHTGAESFISIEADGSVALDLDPSGHVHGRIVGPAPDGALRLLWDDGDTWEKLEGLETPAGAADSAAPAALPAEPSPVAAPARAGMLQQGASPAVSGNVTPTLPPYAFAGGAAHAALPTDALPGLASPTAPAYTLPGRRSPSPTAALSMTVPQDCRRRTEMDKVRTGGMVSAKVAIALDGGVAKQRWVALHGDVLWVMALNVADAQAAAAKVSDLPRLSEKAIHLARAKVTRRGTSELVVENSTGVSQPAYSKARLCADGSEDADRWERLLREAAGKSEAFLQSMDRAAYMPRFGQGSEAASENGGLTPQRGVRGLSPAASAASTMSGNGGMLSQATSTYSPRGQAVAAAGCQYGGLGRDPAYGEAAPLSPRLGGVDKGSFLSLSRGQSPSRLTPPLPASSGTSPSRGGGLSPRVGSPSYSSLAQQLESAEQQAKALRDLFQKRHASLEMRRSANGLGGLSPSASTPSAQSWASPMTAATFGQPAAPVPPQAASPRQQAALPREPMAVAPPSEPMAMPQASGPAPREYGGAASALFDRLDTNKDGVLTRSEFAALAPQAISPSSYGVANDARAMGGVAASQLRGGAF